jgi:hypothetical protein
MKLLVFALTTLSVYAAHFVDVQFDEYNRPIIINATIPGLFRSSRENASSFDVVISMSSRSVIEVGSEDSFDSASFTGEISTPENFLLNRDTFTLDLLTHMRCTRTVVMVGIGRRSSLLDTYERITLLRNDSFGSGVLILNDSSASNFNSSCVPESVSMIRLDHNVGHGLDQFDISYRMERPQRLSLEQITVELTSHIPAKFRAVEELLTIPSPLARQIYHIITASGAMIDENHSSATSCNRESLIELLPDVTLIFSGSGSRLVMEPEDYISFDDITNVCRLNFMTILTTPFFNPLALKYLNIHITRHELLICDPLL